MFTNPRVKGVLVGMNYLQLLPCTVIVEALLISLKRNNIVKVGQLLQLKDDDLLRMRNFGKKSLDEMKERLRMRGFIVPDTETDGLDDLGGEEPFEDEVED